MFLTKFEKYNLPCKFNRSSRNRADNSAVTKTDKAPSGVTNVAGAYAYARKFADSPTAIEIIPAHQIGS